MFTFSGPAFQGLSPQTACSTISSGSSSSSMTLSYLASKLFILDPVYGVLRSLDGIQPYRLEMGCKDIIPLSSEKGGDDNDESKKTTTTIKKKKETLASFWKESVTSCLSTELINLSPTTNNDHIDTNNAATDRDIKGGGDNSVILVNLASEEYSSSIHPPSLPPNTTFLNIVFRHQGRVISVHAKRARGLMARYLAENNAHNLEDVSGFDFEGYSVCCCGGGGGAGQQSKKKRNEEALQLWETVNVVGDNVQIVQMVFDRQNAPTTPSAKVKTAVKAKTATKPKSKVATSKSSSSSKAKRTSESALTPTPTAEGGVRTRSKRPRA